MEILYQYEYLSNCVRTPPLTQQQLTYDKFGLTLG